MSKFQTGYERRKLNTMQLLQKSIGSSKPPQKPRTSINNPQKKFFNSLASIFFIILMLHLSWMILYHQHLENVHSS